MLELINSSLSTPQTLRPVPLIAKFAAYTEWRNRLGQHIQSLRGWLNENELIDAQAALRLEQLCERLRDDRLLVAFVAEFSRGKSELINAIFFAEYGDRILPSSAGRTTMCPTELMYDPDKPPCIELLPIGTRCSSSTSLSDYKRLPDEWTRVPLDINSASAMRETLRHVCEINCVDLTTAEELGLAPEAGSPEAISAAKDNVVEVPRWRHAIINFPHPLLKQGLVILDTPGLNALGAEPELTLSLLPNAHAILFMLAADTGVTQSDLTIWRAYVKNSDKLRKGRLVVLNKIDGQWDDLKTEAEINAEIDRQAASCAAVLELPENQVFPISAQKGLVAKINANAQLLARSRLSELERELAETLIPAKRDIVRDNTDSEFRELNLRTRALLESRLNGVRKELGELTELRGKNKGVIEHMMSKVRIEKEKFEATLHRYYAVRNIFTTLSNRLFTHIGLDALRALTHTTRASMQKATFSSQLSEAMEKFFAATRNSLAASREEISEIHSMMEAIYQKFSLEHGLKLESPATFSLLNYDDEIDRLENWCDTHLNSMMPLIRHEKGQLTHKFFEEISVQARRAFQHANRHSENWLNALMSPIETQVQEYQIQLNRRLDSIKRIHQTTDTLEERITGLMHSEAALVAQTQELDLRTKDIRGVLDAGDDVPQKMLVANL